jgi:hypothetical protein
LPENLEPAFLDRLPLVILFFRRVAARTGRRCGRRFPGAGRRTSVGSTDDGRFELEPEALVTQLAKWHELRADLWDDQKHGHELVAASCAGDEPASRTMANSVHESGREFLRHNEALVQYVDGHIAALTAALATYVHGEESAVHALRGQVR